jgi:hypothetical protein
MPRRALLVALACSAGCGHNGDAALGAALFAVTAVAASAGQAVLDDYQRHGGGSDYDPSEVDENGRPARLIQRVACPGFDRSYKLLCVSLRECYFEKNDGTIVHCPEGRCAEVPPALDAWCRGD